MPYFTDRDKSAFTFSDKDKNFDYEAFARYVLKLHQGEVIYPTFFVVRAMKCGCYKDRPLQIAEKINAAFEKMSLEQPHLINRIPLKDPKQYRFDGFRLRSKPQCLPWQDLLAGLPAAH